MNSRYMHLQKLSCRFAFPTKMANMCHTLNMCFCMVLHNLLLTCCFLTTNFAVPLPHSHTPTFLYHLLYLHVQFLICVRITNIIIYVCHITFCSVHGIRKAFG